MAKNIKILVTFNTCAPSIEQDISNWHRVFDNVLRQNTDVGFHSGDGHVDVNVDYVISDCMSSKNHLVDMRYMMAKTKIFKPESNVASNSLRVNASLPLSFNHACKKMIKEHGEYDYYVMWSSNVFFNDVNSLVNLLAGLYTTENAAIVSPGNAEDGSYIMNGPTRCVEPGSLNSTDFLIFNKNFVKKYNNKPWVDSFKTEGPQAILSYQAPAIKKTWIVVPAVKLETQGLGKDNAYACFENSSIVEGLSESFNIKKIIREGRDLGLGFTNSPHAPDAYVDGLAKTFKLHKFIIKNLYVSKEIFNYEDPKLSQFSEHLESS